MPFWKKNQFKKYPQIRHRFEKKKKEKEKEKERRRRRIASLSRHDQLSDVGAHVGPPGCHAVGEPNNAAGEHGAHLELVGNEVRQRHEKN
jgi:hypothetical protein